MKIMSLEFVYYILILSCILSLIAFKIKIDSQKRDSIKNLMPEEKFLLKEIFLNAGLIPSSALDNEFLKSLEEEELVYKKSTIKKDIIEYGIKNWIKKEIKRDISLVSNYNIY